MSEELLYWLPTLTELDGSLRDWELIGQEASPWLQPFGIKPRDVVQFINDISPCLMALFLAGYEVPKVELSINYGAPHMWAGNAVNLSNQWLVIDLKYRRVGLRFKPAGQGEVIWEHDEVQIYYSPITLEYRGPVALALALAEFQSDFEKNFAALVPPQLTDLREELRIVEDLPGAILSLAPQFLPSSELMDSTAYITLNYPGQKPTTKQEFFAIVNGLIFQPLLWFVTARINDSAIEDGLGMCWAFNPNNWFIDPETWNEKDYASERYVLGFGERLFKSLQGFYKRSIPYRGMADAIKDYYKGEKNFFDIRDFYQEKIADGSPEELNNGPYYLENQILSFLRDTPRNKHSRTATARSLALFLSKNDNFAVTDDHNPEWWNEFAFSSAGEAEQAESLFFRHLETMLAKKEPNLGLFERQKIIGTLRSRPLAESIFRLAALGLIDLEGVGQVTEEAGESYVQLEAFQYTYQQPGDGVLLRYPTYSEGVYLFVEHPIGFSIQESVAWEYVPPVDQEEIDPAVNEKLKEINQTPARAKLIIVAAPGVKIINSGWPQRKCELVIYRVQDHALVPRWGTPIDTYLLERTRMISPLDALETYDEQNVSTAGPYREFRKLPLDELLNWVGTGDETTTTVGWLSDPQKIPFVIDKPINEKKRSGIRLIYNCSAGIFNSVVEGYRGLSVWGYEKVLKGSWIQIDITVDVIAGDQRFAYELIPYMTWEMRDTPDGKTTYPLDVISYIVVIYRTPGVKITVSDPRVDFKDAIWEMAWWHDHQVNGMFQYFFYVGDIQNIPVQGTPLPYSPVVEDIEVEWFRTIESSVIEKSRVSPDYRTTVQILEPIAEEAIKNFLDIVFGSIPVVGDAADWLEILLALQTGKDKWGRPVTHGSLLLMMAFASLPVVSSAWYKTIRGVVSDTNPKLLEVNPDYLTATKSVEFD